MSKIDTDQQAFGEAGLVCVTNGSLPAGQYCALEFVTAGSITSINAPLATGLTGLACPSFFRIYTPFYGATVTGTVIAYRDS